MNVDIKCKCGLDKFINKDFCCINCEINNTHNYLCTKYIINKKNKKLFYKQNIKNTNPYNKNNIIDYLAIRYHKKRNYLYGYLTRLQELESEGKIEILKTQRVCFGILYHEAYSFVMWRPKT